MRVFAEHKRRFAVHLRPEDVLHQLPATGLEEVEQALSALAGWGNLKGDPDTSRVGSLEDFYRRRLLYQLTREGEAAERALATFETEIGRRGELQSVALETSGCGWGRSALWSTIPIPIQRWCTACSWS